MQIDTHAVVATLTLLTALLSVLFITGGTLYSRVVTKNEGEEKKERQQSASVGGEERVEPRGLLD